MLSVKDVSNLVNVSNVHLKKLIKEELNENQDYVRTVANNGAIKILPEGAGKILSNHGYGIQEGFVTNFNIKGGISKSVTNVSMAHYFSMLKPNNKPVLLIDTDLENCASSMLLDEPLENPITLYDVVKNDLKIKDVAIPSKYEGLDLLPSHLKILKVDKLLAERNPKKLLDKYLEGIFDKYSMVIFDCPPSLNNLTRAILMKVDKLNMIVNSDIFTLESTYLLMDELEEMTEEWESKMPQLTITQCRYIPTRVASMETSKAIRESDLSKYLLPVQIKESASVANATNEGKTIIEGASKSVRDSFSEMCQHIVPIENRATIQ
jgi:chromosome partitioning protein